MISGTPQGFANIIEFGNQVFYALKIKTEIQT